MSFSDISKKVGWNKREVSYPTLDEIELADVEQLLIWNRCLTSPNSSEEVKLISAVVSKLDEERRKLDG